MADDARRVALGKLGRPHGVRGEVRLAPYNPGSDLPGHLEAVDLGDGALRRVLSARPGPSGSWLVTLEGVTDREAAAALTGREVSVPRGALPEAPGETYLADLVGLTVEDRAGRPLGTVTGVEAAGLQDLLEVEGRSGTWLLPAAAPLLVEIDRAHGRLVVDVPEGLVDLGGEG